MQGGNEMGWRVLVVDDEPRYGELLRRVLERDGFAVTAVDNGEAATELLLAGKVDLLVTDLQMPGLSGADLTELARRLPRAPQVLVVTAQKGMIEEAGRRIQGTQCLLKPFTLEDFRAKIGVLTGQWPQPAAGDVPDGVRQMQ
jgi:DNA-binding response OmpR family regulator